MMEERIEYMTHETLKGGRCITWAKGHDQEIIMALIISKGIFVNIGMFHMYLVVSKT